METLSKFVRQYLETALWSTHDNADESGGEPLDKNYTITDFAPEAIAKAIEDCRNFCALAGADLESVGDDKQNGHDFWLTRNGHGCGFWDRGYGDAGDRLSEVARTFGNCDAYLGDDGSIYLS